MPGLGTWLAAFFTLCMLSFLYKDNPFFRIAESFFAGLSLGYYVGVNMMQKLHGEVLPQVGDTMLSLSWTGIGTLWNVVMVVGVLSVLIYFYFSAEHKGAVGGISRVGIWFLMVSFGAAFGYTVMGRISLLIGRMVFLVNEWARPLIGLIT